MAFSSEFLQFLRELKVWLGERMVHNVKLTQLQEELIKSQNQVATLEKKLKTAQHLLGVEMDKRASCEQQVWFNAFCVFGWVQ